MLVPKGLHVLVRLRALGVEGAAYFSFVVLVKGEDEMKFVHKPGKYLARLKIG